MAIACKQVVKSIGTCCFVLKRPQTHVKQGLTRNTCATWVGETHIYSRGAQGHNLRHLGILFKEMT